MVVESKSFGARTHLPKLIAIASAAVAGLPLLAGVPQAAAQNTGGSLDAIACSTSTTCIAVGVADSGDVGVVVPVTNGIAGTPKTVPGTRYLAGVACADAMTCLAVGSSSSGNGGVLVSISNGAPSGAQPVPGTAVLTDIACPTSTGCLAAGFKASSSGVGPGGGVLVPISSGAPGAAQAVAGTGGLFGIACPTASTCLAAGSRPAFAGGAVVPITDGSAGTVRNVDGTDGLDGIACGSATQCIAAGGGGSTGIVAPVNSGIPGAGAKAAGTGILSGVACTTTTKCLAVGQLAGGGGAAVPVTGGSPGGTQTISAAHILWSVACPSANSCIGVGEAQINPTEDLNVGVVVPMNDSGAPVITGTAPSTSGGQTPSGDNPATTGAAPSASGGQTPSGDNSSLSASPATVDSNGGMATMSATFTDTNKQPIAGTQVNFALQSGPAGCTVTFQPASAVTDSGGRVNTQAAIPRGCPGVFTLQAIKLDPLTLSATVTETAPAAPGLPRTGTGPPTPTSVSPVAPSIFGAALALGSVGLVAIGPGLPRRRARR